MAALPPPLAHSRITAPGASPERWALFLHGILGSGNNWRTFARRLVEARPSWGAVLVDLREHGGSKGLAPPHTVAAAGDDVARLAAGLGGEVGAVIGHSFGGKVSLSYLRQTASPPGLCWVIDATPGARPTARGSESTVNVVAMLARMPRSFASRQAFVEAVCAEGHDQAFALWLGMNLEREGSGVRLAIDPVTIQAMLDDYLSLDLWGVVESPPGNTRLHVVVGGKSRVFDQTDLERLERAAERAPGRVFAHVLPAAGHWVHVDDPDGLLALVSGSM